MQQQNKSINTIERKINQTNLRILSMQRSNSESRREVLRHRQLANKILNEKHKVALSMIQIQDQKEVAQVKERERLKALKKINAQSKQKHSQQIKQIMIAISNSKIENAVELKKLSEEHKLRMKQISQADLQKNRSKNKNMRAWGEMKKQEYWKQKLLRMYRKRQRQRQQKSALIEERSKKLQQVLDEQRKLAINSEQFKKQQEAAKKAYIRSVYMPVRRIAEQIHRRQNPQSSSVLEQLAQDIRLSKSEHGMKPMQTLNKHHKNSNNLNIQTNHIDQGYENYLYGSKPINNKNNQRISEITHEVKEEEAKLKILLDQLKKKEK